MDKFTRVCRLHRLLQGSHLPVPASRIAEHLECSAATARRIIDALRAETGDPIPYDRASNGYQYLSPKKHRSALPFLFFTTDELNALLVINQHLETLQSGILSEALAPLQERIQTLLSSHGDANSTLRLQRRILTKPMGQRGKPGRCFSVCAEAVLQRNRLMIEYHGRSSDRQDLRQISPQRLIHYRDNWYVHAWCHVREQLRIFAVERILRAERCTDSAIEVSDDELESDFAGSFGIFSGAPTNVAQLRFSPISARWVAEECWHPMQQGRPLPDGSFLLEIPFNNPTELIMEILKHGADVEVLGPRILREAVETELRKALNHYS